MKILKFCLKIIDKFIFPRPVGFDLPEDYFENEEYFIDEEEAKDLLERFEREEKS